MSNPGHATCRPKTRTLHACNDIHGTGFMLALNEQDVRLYCCVFKNLKALSLVFDTVYEVVNRLTLVCYFVFHIHYNGDDDSVLIFVA